MEPEGGCEHWARESDFLLQNYTKFLMVLPSLHYAAIGGLLSSSYNVNIYVLVGFFRNLFPKRPIPGPGPSGTQTIAPNFPPDSLCG